MVLNVHDIMSQGYQHHFIIYKAIRIICDSGTHTHTHTPIFTLNSKVEHAPLVPICGGGKTWNYKPQKVEIQLNEFKCFIKS